MTKKQLIMEKAWELFSEKGFESTSVQQITERCGISKGAFYLSFKTKDELIYAMIDSYMQQFIADIDFVVKNEADPQHLLVAFYKCIFKRFNEQSQAARIFLNEQAITSNKELFKKVHAYETILTDTIIEMLEKCYGDKLQDTQYDLVFCIKGFLRISSELFLFHDVPIDFDKVAHSLAEKTDILANYMTKPFITKEVAHIAECPFIQEISPERLVQILESNILDTDESIERESLILLKEQVQQQTLSKAIIKGLIENIRHLANCKWTAYVLLKYFEL